jgi:hypothetical protein
MANLCSEVIGQPSSTGARTAVIGRVFFVNGEVGREIL